MNIIWKYPYPIVFAGLCVLGILFFCVIRLAPVKGPPAFTESGGIQINAEETYWQQRIKVVGAPAAYQELVNSVASATASEAHMRAHAFGAALYKEKGLAGAIVCDERFSGGCFHQFFGMAIAEHGLSVVPQLDTQCQSLGDHAGTCKHGIGHGILSSLGYGIEDLKKALSVCDTIHNDNAFGGCYSGAVMEYNLRIVLRDEGKVRRPFSGDPFDPCDRIPSIHMSACAASQPEWWRQERFGYGTTTAVYANLGSYCRKMSSDPDVLRACFFGIGNGAVPVTNSDAAQIVRLCDASSADTQDALYCKAGAAARTYNQDGSDHALPICQGLQGTMKTFCVAYATHDKSMEWSPGLEQFISNQ